MTGGCADFTLECSGRAAVLRQAINSVGLLGTCGIVGATAEGTEATFNVNDVMIPARRIMGIVQGEVVSRTFIPKLIELYRQGRFPFDRLVKFYPSTRSTKPWRIAKPASRSSLSCVSRRPD